MKTPRLSSHRSQVFPVTRDVFPPYAANGSTTTQFDVNGSFDGPKMNFYNDTAYQWWYIDAVSEDLTQSIVMLFFINSIGASGEATQPFNSIALDSVFTDGSFGNVIVAAESALIDTIGDGASGVMKGTGYSWFESPDLSSLYILIDDKTNNITGSVQLASTAPHHAVCGPPAEGASLVIVPHLGWANSIPDASASVDIDWSGKKLKFQGVGYHDSNWGDVPLIEVLGTWYWGHARVGPYSIVWFDTLDKAGNEHQSGYIAKAGAVVAESCGEMSVRPSGQNSSYPPLPGATPSGFQIVYDMGDAGIFEANITNHKVIENSEPRYIRWVGSTVGGIRGQEMYEGVGLYEWMGA